MSLTKINTPVLGESISEATVSGIHKKIGDYVKADELIFELETDKVTLEVCAPSSGFIHSIAIKEQDTVLPGNLLCELSSEGKAPNLQESKPQQPEVQASNAQSNQINPTPSAIKTATILDIDISKIQGSGKNNQVLKGDIIQASECNSDNNPQNKPVQSASALNNHSQSNVQSSVAGQNTSQFGQIERVKMSKLRQTIAKRLKDSQNTAAILTTFNEIDMQPVMELRSKYKDQFQKKYDAKLGFMSFFVKATVMALQEIPAINAEIDGNDVVYKNFYNIGVAVGTENGLVVPILRNCENLSLADIETQIVNFGKKARDGKLSISDMQNGTFTISNGGVYGSLLSTPIINPPQSGILGLHNIVKRPVVVNDQIVIRPMMYTALSYDHRIVDGKEAVTFLVRVKELIEDPARLVLGL